MQEFYAGPPIVFIVEGPPRFYTDVDNIVFRQNDEQPLRKLAHDGPIEKPLHNPVIPRRNDNVDIPRRDDNSKVDRPNDNQPLKRVI